MQSAASRFPFSTVFSLIAFVVSAPSSLIAANADQIAFPPVAFRQDTPASLADLKAMEQHLEALLKRVSPAAVAVRVGASTGSGVVISADGMVLTVAHVTEDPDRDVRVVFPDGRTVRGKSLGANHERDSGLIKITEAGPWPHLEMGQLDQVHPGDWVVALGHPGGYDSHRSLVVRFGRLIRQGRSMLQTDCTLTAGDSGGPLLDMTGRVIGIHSRISSSANENYHVPISTYTDTWERLAKSEKWGRDPSERPAYVGARGADDPEGCRLQRVDEGSPAAKAGLKPGDLVLSVDGRKVTDYPTYRRLLREAQIGQQIRFLIKRDEEELSLTVKAETRRPRR
jgi:serine protease Do